MSKGKPGAISTFFGLVICVTGLVAIPAHADGNVKNGEWSVVPPPPEEARAIRLSGKSPNPSPETWLRRRIDNPAPWWLGQTGALVVRNVSQATLTPFFPDRAKATGAAMVIAPGGGTLVLGMELQGYSVARWLNERGIAAFVLKYRLVPTPKEIDPFLQMVGMPMPVYSDVVPPAAGAAEEIATREDALEAIRYVRNHASELGLVDDKIGMIGFSAGAYTTVSVALTADDSSRPDLVAAIYGTMGGHFEVPANAPPMFFAASFDDPLNPDYEGDPYSNAYLAWRRARVPAEFHIFDTGGHGFSIAPQGTSSDQWTGLLEHWLRERAFVSK